MTYWVDGKQYVAFAVGGNRGGLTTRRRRGLGIQAQRHAWTRWKRRRRAADHGRPDRPRSSWASRSPDAADAVYGGIPFDGTLHAYEYNFTPQVVQVPWGYDADLGERGSVIHTTTAARYDHSITRDISGGGGTLGLLRPAGTFNFNCTPHPWMLGRVIIQ